MLMLAGRWMSAHRWHYLCSRLPGYPVQEISASFLWHGGPLLVNGVTALFCAALVFFFVLILHRYRCRDALLAGLALAFVPMTYIASVMAKGLPLGARVRGGRALFHLAPPPGAGRPAARPGRGVPHHHAGDAPLPAAAAHLSIAAETCRAYAPTRQTIYAGPLIMGVCALLVSALCFLPVYLHFGRGFFTYYPAKMLPISILANATVRFWGVLGLLALLAALIALAFPAGRRGLSTFAQRPATVHRRVWAALVLCYLLLFLKLPLEAAYLLPALPFLPAWSGRCAAATLFPRVVHRPAHLPLPLHLSRRDGAAVARAASACGCGGIRRGCTGRVRCWMKPNAAAGSARI